MVWNDSKMKNKLLEISSFYTCVPKTTIIRGTVPVIRSETDRIFCHFGPFFAFSPHNNPQNQNFEKMKKKNCICLHFTHEYQKSWLYMLPEIWSATETIFCHFGPCFGLLPHYWPWKLKFGKNVKNAWRFYPFTCVYSQLG